MIHYRNINRIIGILLLIEACILFVCSFLPLYFHEADFFAFLSSSLITACIGELLLVIGGRRSKDNPLSRRDGYIVVTVSWIVFSIFGALPYFISGHISSYTDAFFETMSGFTTTGASIIRNIEAMPHGLLFWRGLTQWIGGLGIVFFTVAVLPIFGVGDVQLFAAEATGPTHGKLHPRISVSGRWILFVYAVLTIACIISLEVCGMGIFDSINHAFSTISTGGYSTRNTSVAYFQSPKIEYVITLFMFLSGINFGLLYFLLFKGKIKKMFLDTEFNWYLLTTCIMVLLVGIGIFVGTNEGVEESLRHSLFQVVSATTSTGFTTTNYTIWPPSVWMLLGFCMYLGGCAGSTTGGMKSIRTAILFKTLRNEFHRILHPNAILPIRNNGKVIPKSTKQTVLAFTIFYLGLILISWLFFMTMGVNFTDSYGAVVAFIGNTGFAIGSFGTETPWGDLPTICKWYGSLLMLIGRLEIFSVLIITIPSFWKQR